MIAKTVVALATKNLRDHGAAKLISPRLREPWYVPAVSRRHRGASGQVPRAWACVLGARFASGGALFQVGDVQVGGAAEERVRVLQVLGRRQQVRVRPQRVPALDAARLGHAGPQRPPPRAASGAEARGRPGWRRCVPTGRRRHGGGGSPPPAPRRARAATPRRRRPPSPPTPRPARARSPAGRAPPSAAACPPGGTASRRDSASRSASSGWSCPCPAWRRAACSCPR